MHVEEVRFLPQRKYEAENLVSYSCIICIFPYMPAAKRTVRVVCSKYTCFIVVGFFYAHTLLTALESMKLGALSFC